MARMLRILSAAVLVVIVAAGCGGAARPQRAAFHGVPRALAQGWERQAAAVASAASAGNSCLALHLATSLRADVVESEHKLPLRLRSPLIAGVSSLADRIKCTPVVTNPTPPEKPKEPQEPKQKPNPPEHGKRHRHDKDHDK